MAITPEPRRTGKAERIAASLLPWVAPGSTRLYWRHAAGWGGFACIVAVLALVDRRTYPGVWCVVPVATVVYALYWGIEEWASPLVGLIWWALPAGSVVLAIVLANATDGDFLVPAAATATALLASVFTAEWLRRRARGRRPAEDA